MEQMTQVSRLMMDRAKEPMSISDAVSMLEEGAKFRSFSDKLNAFAYGRDIRKVLTNGLVENHPEAKFDAIDKKVRNWLNGRTQSVSKQDAIELSFVMQLSLEDAEKFISMVTEEGIHWRDANEIVYGYALMNGKTYQEAQAILASVPEEIFSDASDSFEEKTALVKDKAMRISNDAELIDFLTASRDSLGKFHNTAYQVFSDYMGMLESAGIEDGLADEKDMSVREILESYLYRKSVPVTGKKNMLTEAQKAIRADWPDETTLSRMKLRQADVTRKVLILLFLATNGADAEEDYDFDDDEELTRDEIFLDSVIRMNRMLSECGYMKLDPRNRFDWMTLYAMCAEDIFDVDERFGDFLSNLFGGGNE